MTNPKNTATTETPEYRTVVFRDQASEVKFLTRSTRTSEHTTTWPDGNIYPVIDVDVHALAASA